MDLVLGVNHIEAGHFTQKHDPSSLTEDCCKKRTKNKKKRLKFVDCVGIRFLLFS